MAAVLLRVALGSGLCPGALGSPWASASAAQAHGPDPHHPRLRLRLADLACEKGCCYCKKKCRNGEFKPAGWEEV